MISKDKYLTAVTISFYLALNVLCFPSVQILPVENSRPAYEAGLLQGFEADQEEPF